MIISDQSDVSDSDDDRGGDDLYILSDPILKLQRKIIENISVYNYLPICVNVCWIIDSHLPDNATETEKIALAVCILDSIHLLRQFRDIHFSIIEKLYMLANNGKLHRLKKRVSWVEWAVSWFYY
jgi:hypothetical protein